MKKVFILAFVFVFSACGEKNSLEPQSQKDFKKLVSSLSEQYEEAENSGNALAEKEFEERFNKELKKTNRRATSWVGDFVKSSGDKDQITIELSNEGQTYHLVLIDSESVNFTKELKKGDKVIFTGDLGHETSFTTSGALEEPEFRFYPFKMKRPNDEEWVNQSQEKVQQILADRKAENADSYIKIEVATQCEKVIKSQLRFPESADFSWLGEAVKQDDGRWIYRNKVEAKNALGNEIPYRFYCLADGEYLDDSAKVSILKAEFIDG